VLLLLHGFLGHAHWWDFIAPWFARDYRVIALDFGGMGDSSARPAYSNAGFVGDVGAMLQMIGPAKITLVGHSFGGRTTIFAAHRYSQLLERAMVIDSKLGFADAPLRSRFAPRIKQVYPDLETACTHFRLVPGEPPVLPRIMRHLAVHSIKREGGGFVWKFDQALTAGVDWGQMLDGELLSQIDLPLDFIAGEFSAIVSPEIASRIGKALRNGRGPIIIPSAYHHVPVDQPLALVAVMRALLASNPA
jgi:pimeloyl-ACP methyl ester carboxylesterase